MMLVSTFKLERKSFPTLHAAVPGYFAAVITFPPIDCKCSRKWAGLYQSYMLCIVIVFGQIEIKAKVVVLRNTWFDIECDKKMKFETDRQMKSANSGRADSAEFS